MIDVVYTGVLNGYLDFGSLLKNFPKFLKFSLNREEGSFGIPSLAAEKMALPIAAGSKRAA